MSFPSAAAYAAAAAGTDVPAAAAAGAGAIADTSDLDAILSGMLEAGMPEDSPAVMRMGATIAKRRIEAMAMASAGAAAPPAKRHRAPKPKWPSC